MSRCSSRLIGVLILTRRVICTDVHDSSPIRSSNSFPGRSIASRVLCISACAMSTTFPRLGSFLLFLILAFNRGILTGDCNKGCDRNPSIALPRESVTEETPAVCVSQFVSAYPKHLQNSQIPPRLAPLCLPSHSPAPSKNETSPYQHKCPPRLSSLGWEFSLLRWKSPVSLLYNP